MIEAKRKGKDISFLNTALTHFAVSCFIIGPHRTSRWRPTHWTERVIFYEEEWWGKLVREEKRKKSIEEKVFPQKGINKCSNVKLKLSKGKHTIYLYSCVPLIGLKNQNRDSQGRWVALYSCCRNQHVSASLPCPSGSQWPSSGYGSLCISGLHPHSGVYIN